MFGWFNDARTSASRLKRAIRAASLAKVSGNSLMATSRFSLVSRARYTSPIPPAPSADRISYGPICEPAASDIGVLILHQRELCTYTQIPGNQVRVPLPQIWDGVGGLRCVPGASWY